jgi:hypothetical protein
VRRKFYTAISEQALNNVQIDLILHKNASFM